MRLTENEILSCLLILLPESISQDKYKDSVYLLVKEMHCLNNEKFNLVMHIAEKAFQESQKQIFDYNYIDLKNELRFLMKETF